MLCLWLKINYVYSCSKKIHALQITGTIRKNIGLEKYGNI
jgi:hypothetical protein